VTSDASDRIGPPCRLAPHGLILDMDGVLADSEPLQARAWVLLLARYGITEDMSFFDRWIGIPNTETALDVAARWPLHRTATELIAERELVYLGLVAEGLSPYPGVRERLEALASAPKAVATSACRAEATRVLEVLSMAPLFAAVITADDVSRTKPDPEPYLRAAAALVLHPSTCVAIEDSPAGVASARAAGCYVLAVTTTHRPEVLGPAHERHTSTVSALDSVLRLLGRHQEA